MKSPNKRSILIAGVRRSNYPRDEDWMRLFNSAAINVTDLSIPSDYVNRWEKNRRLSWVKNLIYRNLGWTLKLPSLMRCIWNRQAQTVFVFRNNHLLLLFLALFKKLSRLQIEIIFDSWISISLKAEASGCSGIIVWTMKLLERSALAQADKTIAISKEYARHFRQMGVRLKASNLSVVPISAGPQWEKQPVRPTETAPPFFIYWGNFLEQHGTPILLKAVILNACNNFRLVLCGDGKERRQLTNQINESIRPKIDFLGQIEDTQLIQLVDASIAGFGHLKKTHDYNLVLPNKAVQAFARGKPIFMVAGDISAEWGKERERVPIIFFDGTPHDLAQKMAKTSADSLRMEDMGKCARDFYLKHHSWPVVKSAMESALNFT